MKENVILIGVAIVLIVGSIIYLVSGTPGAVSPSEPIVTTPADDEVCGRYHLRKRTPRFFKRGTG